MGASRGDAADAHAAQRAHRPRRRLVAPPSLIRLQTFGRMRVRVAAQGATVGPPPREELALGGDGEGVLGGCAQLDEADALQERQAWTGEARESLALAESLAASCEKPLLTPTQKLAGAEEGEAARAGGAHGDEGRRCVDTLEQTLEMWERSLNGDFEVLSLRKA